MRENTVENTVFDLNWKGSINTENVNKLVDLLQRLLVGRKFAIVNSYNKEGNFPKVRTNQQLRNIYIFDGIKKIRVKISTTHEIYSISIFKEDINNKKMIFERCRVSIFRENSYLIFATQTE